MKSLPVSYRLAVTSRVLAALFGGYLLAALASICMSLWLPMARAEAVISGMMTSFLVYLVAVLWCFASRSAWQAWLGLLLPGIVLAAFGGLGYGLGQS
ncbi:DUF3649 domain-containing protein [Pseudomonas sp. RA_35y_Pfl2_P32]|uniref:DUF3649 domain-containing protein n=1 Tax=Pseudomonas sp. RA_35y_Pfl2_P32 TaxID=3088705 RepID=UPI0030DD89F2